MDRILVIPDAHIPYHHKSLFRFLKDLRKDIKPTRVICTGDELDNHAFSMHDHNPDLPGAKEEFELAVEHLHQLVAIFPKVDLCHSNHGSLVFRRAAKFGLLSRFIKPYENYLEVPVGWKWHKSITDGRITFCHQAGANVLMAAKHYGFSVVQGHYHTKLEIQHWAHGFGATVGCLIDDESPAFDYNKNQIARPILGTIAIFDDQPRIFRL